MSEIKTWQQRKEENEGWLPHDDFFMLKEITELRAALAEADKDAARYRWLRDSRSYSYGMQSDSPAEHGINYEWHQRKYEERNFSISDSIDQAIREGGE